MVLKIPLGLHGLMVVSNMINKEKDIFLTHLIDRVFKILPLSEQDNNIAKTYVQRLMIDIKSANSLFDGILIDLIIKINSITENDLSHIQIRRIVFECINVINKIKEEIENDT